MLMKKITLMALLATTLACILPCQAEEPAVYFEENGIKYCTYPSVKYCKVVENRENQYTGVVEIPDSAGGLPVTIIDSFAFKRCKNLTEVRVGNNVTELENLSFWDCHALEKVVLPETLQLLGDRTFMGCWSLKEVNIPEGVSWICTETFKYCVSLEEIVLPESVKHIDIEAFMGCGVRNINLPDSVRHIGDDAFRDSALETIHIGKGLSLIYPGVFNGCVNLREVYITAPEPPKYHAYSAFICEENLGNIVLYVPQASMEKYKESEYWSQFKEIRSIETAGIADVETDRKNPDVIHDLQGRRLKHTVPGINIVNGKKILVR